MTITATPPVFSSVHDNLVYTVTDPHTADPVTYPNYKFIADVYIGATLVARIKKVPNPVTGVGIFNVGQIVRNYVSTYFNPTDLVIVCQNLSLGEFNIGVTLVFGEEYGFTEFIGLVSDTQRTFFNFYNSKTHSTGLGDLPFPPSATDRPLVSTVRCDSNFNLFPIYQSTDPVSVLIQVYDSSNTVTTSFSQSLGAPVENDMHILNLSKRAINAHTGDAINDGSRYFTVTVLGTVFRFNIDCECIYDVYSLHFLNKYGGFDTKDFAKVSRQTIAIEKKDFGKLPYTVDVSGVVSYKNANNVYNESRSVYSSQYKEKMALNSDLLTDAEYRWLQQLIVSPMVYIEMDFAFFPVVVAENNYEPKKVVNDDLTNLAINIEFGDQLNAQFR